jgi:hypothetical protein
MKEWRNLDKPIEAALIVGIWCVIDYFYVVKACDWERLLICHAQWKQGYKSHRTHAWRLNGTIIIITIITIVIEKRI